MVTKITHLNTIKIVVLGSKRCGKSALTVRYLTKRFIGEYRSNVDLLYKQTIVVDGVTSEIEILDISRWTNDESFPLEQIRWADALVVVYSICDETSFDDAHTSLARTEKLLGGSPSTRPAALLLGNKRDLEHGRTVAIDAGRDLALRHGCLFSEVSAAESYEGVNAAFGEVIREARMTTSVQSRNSIQQQSVAPASRQRKISMFAVSKMIGAIIGHGRSSSAKGGLLFSNNNNNNNIVDNDHNNHNHNNNNKKKKRPSLSL